jgi:hypothetical protein
MQLLSIFTKILGAGHQTSHRFEHSLSPLRDLVPCPFEARDRSSAERRDDGGQGGEIVHPPTFLEIWMLAQHIEQSA